MHNDIIDHIARDSGHDKGYEAGMERAWSLVGELVEFYKKERVPPQCDTGNEARYQAALYAQMVIKMNRFNEILPGTVPITRYSHVRDSMYEIDDHGKKYNEEYMTISLPTATENFLDDATLPETTNYQAEILYLRHDDTGGIYPCIREATNKLGFRIVYDGQWAGNGEEYQSKRMLSITKPELLVIADEAMVYTDNEHHCFLEHLTYQKTDSNGIVHLKLQFGS